MIWNTNGRILHFACTALVLSQAAQANGAQPGLVWSYEMPNETYSNYSVSIGDGGSQVFTDTGKSTRYTRLFSSTETGTVAPQWEASSADHAYYQLVASAETNDRHFTLYQKDDPAGSNDRFATLEAYRSNSSQPAWSYGFPVPIYNHDRMMVECSRDGSVVAVVIENVYNSGEEVYIFDGTGGQPLHFQANMAGWFKYGRLSDDGSTLYLNSESRVKLFDTSTGNELHSMTVFGGTYTGHAISADGRVFAFSRGGGAVAYSRDASGVYALDTNITGSSTEYVNSLALSSNGEVLVLGFSDAVLNRARVQVVRRTPTSTTGTTLLDQSYQGSLASGSYTNWPRDISMSASGDRFAVAFTGDGLIGTNTPELVVFERQWSGLASSPYQVLEDWNCVGSRMELDLSADGNHLAVSGRDTHASSSFGTKVIEYYHLGADLMLTGTPRPGQELTVEFHATTGPRAYLLVTDRAYENPIMTSAGPLLLDRSNGLTVFELDNVGVDGIARGQFLLDTQDYQAGDRLYFQAYSAGPRRLCRTMQSLTLLP
ncbi:MAG: WD40 repeat domain-containing protein [Planctomycetes bacterium]|nr:WD40 repeat domain-containing protein [Planctomycetota bacterium]MCB9903395.1 WD40 repeat domain-containing protein [Planctomycetota bacterium]